MDAEHTRGAAGAPCVLSSPVKAIKKAFPSLSWITNAVIIICLLLLTIRQRISIENNACATYGSQCLLHSTFLKYGRARVPSTLQGNQGINSASKTVRLWHLACVVLLAGDMETNPGPLPLNNGVQASLASQQAQLAH